MKCEICGRSDRTRTFEQSDILEFDEPICDACLPTGYDHKGWDEARRKASEKRAARGWTPSTT